MECCEEGMDHEAADQSSAHIVLDAEPEQAVALDLGQEMKQVCHGHNSDLSTVFVIVREGGHQGLDILEQEWLADIEGPASNRHFLMQLLYLVG